MKQEPMEQSVAASGNGHSALIYRKSRGALAEKKDDIVAVGTLSELTAESTA